MTAQTAFFSLEFMLETDIPTYAGGLGVLAGDLLRSAADKSVPIVGMGIAYSGDTFTQALDPEGEQVFTKSDWQKIDQLTKLPNVVEMTIAGEKAYIGCWRYDIVGLTGFTVPVYLLDSNLSINPHWIRQITDNLYAGGDMRICQELILGFAGVAMLKSLGHTQIQTYHLNEGHSAFVPLALMPDHDFDDNKVKNLCVFTSHTPIPEGHDIFSYDQAYHFAGNYLPWHIKKLAGEDQLSMTHLALNLSRKSFAVSKKHQQTSESIFPGYKFDYVTNGVHHRSWTHNYFQDLYNKYLPGWLEQPGLLINAPTNIPNDALWKTHLECKHKLISYVNRHLTADKPLDENILTISLARRPVGYKRPLLLYRDIERFVRIGAGRLQIIQCGKSHPDDNSSQEIVRQIVQLSKRFKEVLKIVFLENYSPKISRLLVCGSDVWLNTPTKPLEASGTSGMKAALNGVANFSVLDGWWIEAQQKNPESGFNIGLNSNVNNDSEDANDLYIKLENAIMPLYYFHQSAWIARMKQAITLGAYFNTHRAVDEYLSKAWTV